MWTRLTCISSEPARVMTALDTCTDSKRTNTLSTTGTSLGIEDDEPLITYGKWECVTSLKKFSTLKSPTNTA